MSSTKPKINLRSTAVKRIMQEASELSNPEEDDFVAAPLETDIFEWHCTMRGVMGSEYEGGLYHLRILLPPSYPMSAPDIMLLTPSGRFELGKKICIDGLTSFHAGSWQPAWGVRTGRFPLSVESRKKTADKGAITGLRSFWMQGGEALSAIGALDYPKEERKRLAKLSRDWKCPSCGVANRELLPEKSGASSKRSAENESSRAEKGSMQADQAITAGSDLSEDASLSEKRDMDRPSLPRVSIAADTQDGWPATPIPPANHPPVPRPVPTPTIPPTAGTPRSSWLSTRRSHEPPLWIDLCLAFLITALGLLIYKRIG